MKIGVDARSLSGKRTGIGNYLYNLLANIAQLDTKNEYYLYAARDIDFPITSDKWHKRIGSGVLAKVGTLWLYTVGTIRMRNDNIDVFWGPQQMVPYFLRAKTVITVCDLVWHFYPETMAKYNLLISKLLAKSSIRRADKILSISRTTARDVSNIIGIREDKVIISYCSANEMFVPLDREKSKMYITKKYSCSKRFVLAVGTIEPRKNLRTLIEAYELLLKDTREDFDLLIVGSQGWLEGGLSKNKLVSDRIKFTGYVEDNDLVALYSAADIFVFPSIYEGFGMPILEAMACGCPVITSNMSSMPEVAGDAALLVNSLDKTNIAKSIHKLMNEEHMREKYAKKGIERAKEFSWNKSARIVLDTLVGAK